jgi:hypothetical protein
LAPTDAAPYTVAEEATQESGAIHGWASEKLTVVVWRLVWSQKDWSPPKAMPARSIAEPVSLKALPTAWRTWVARAAISLLLDAWVALTRGG